MNLSESSVHYSDLEKVLATRKMNVCSVRVKFKELVLKALDLAVLVS